MILKTFKSIIVLFFVIVIVSTPAFCSKTIDSLKVEFNKAKDVKKIEVLRELSKQSLAESNVDESETYLSKAIAYADLYADKKQKAEILHELGKLYFQSKSQPDTAIEIFSKAVEIWNEIGDFEGANKSLINICSIYLTKSEFDKVLVFADSAEHAAIKAGYDKGIGLAYMQKGNSYHYRGRYEQSINYYQKALKIFEGLDYMVGIAGCINNIGIGLQNIGKHEESDQYFRRSLKLAQKQGNIIGIANAYSNIGSYFYSIIRNDRKKHANKIDSIRFYYQLAYENFKAAGMEMGMNSSINNLGLAYSEAGNYELANRYLSQAHAFWIKNGNKYELSTNLITTGYNFNQIGRYKDAIVVLAECERVADSAKLVETVMMSYKYRTTAYDSLRMYKDALRCLYKYVELQDTVRGEKSRKVIEELKTIYASEKQEQEIANQKKINEKQFLINEQQHRQLVFSVIGVIIVLIVLVLMIIQYIQKRKANNLLVLQNEEILFQKKEIEMQRDEIEAQRNQVVKQRDLIAEQQNNIMDSIHYASRIQEAILPQNDYLGNYLRSNYFVLFKPRDIVSGDFYWFGRKNHKSIVVAADCTGHGVPGAFMSMLGTAFLNEIAANKDIENAHDILNTLREYVIKSLKQTGKEGEQKDGMDLSLYIYDDKAKQIQFAGANNPLLIVRPYDGKTIDIDESRISTQILSQDGTGKEFLLIQLKADKMPIGIYAETKPFTSIDYKVESGDIIYSFSDGYQDQFGGPKNKKFMIKKLKQLLVDNYDISMQEQHFVLDSALEDWKNSSDTPEQVDDILMIGYKIE